MSRPLRHLSLCCLLLLLALPLAAQDEQQPRPPGAEVWQELAEEPHPEHIEQAHAEVVDPHAQFKQSASVQWLARVTGLPVKAAYWAAVGLNFIILASVLGYFLGKFIPRLFRRRTESIQREMREAEAASLEAQRRLADIESRLGRLDAEIAEMRAAAEREGVAEEERIRAAAEQDRERIVQAAQQEIALAARVARRELQAHAAELAVSLAARRIQIDAGTDQALVRRFTEQLRASADGVGPGGRDGERP
jgi:F-type H+-transporting ATPase subunit b